MLLSKAASLIKAFVPLFCKTDTEYSICRDMVSTVSLPAKKERAVSRLSHSFLSSFMASSAFFGFSEPAYKTALSVILTRSSEQAFAVSIPVRVRTITPAARHIAAINLSNFCCLLYRFLQCKYYGLSRRSSKRCLRVLFFWFSVYF